MHRVGEKPGRGQFCCANPKCEWSVTLRDAEDALPPCSYCERGPRTGYIRC